MVGQSEPSSAILASLAFQHPFRKYQQMILDRIEGQVDADHKVHIVAPPGSGKTIIGLELIRRFGRPALVFVPTSTIQMQWRTSVGLFCQDTAWLQEHTSLEADRLATINVLTYQILSTPGENLAFVEQLAHTRWVDDLLTSDQVPGEEEARGRIAALQESHPQAYRRELSRRYRRIKRDFLRRGDFDGRRFLHRNARDLIGRIVALGVGTVVLDECHHLLDYWAFILRELFKALPELRVVGLTATLPDPANESEYENYTSLLGEVDFEVPAPAVIKEGNLAPYRDLVYFCQPSSRERDYLIDIQEHFQAAVERVTETPAFWDWVRRAVTPDPPSPPASPVDREPHSLPELTVVDSFEELYNREPQLVTAGVKYLLARDQLLPPEVLLIDDMGEPMTMDDWLILLERFGLHVLKISSDPAQQAQYRELRQVLLSFGITITERGIRHGRSPGDLVLALSESKDEAVATILSAELGALGERLRAAVITDFERLSARARRLKGILDPDAGSAVRLYQHLVANPETNTLDPILVTGKTVLVDADKQAAVDQAIRTWSGQNHVDLEWEWQSTGSPWMLRLAGRGRSWSPRTYVALITWIFEQGITRCLVGTRGILGEGWDSPSLNTLIDLTSVTTRTGVQQIRGRSMRLDPGWPRKVSHNWDVVCYAPEFERGDADLRRFKARHQNTWGLLISLRPQGSVDGRLVRGLAHVDPALADLLLLRSFQRADLDQITQRALGAVDERDRVHDLWGVGRPYADQTFGTVQLRQPREIQFRTAFTVQNALAGLGQRLAVSTLAAAVPAGLAAIALLPEVPLSAAWLASIGTSGVGALGVLAWNARSAGRLFRKAFLELPAEEVLLDMGRALALALRDAGLVQGELPAEAVTLVALAGGGFELSLAQASPEDTDLFAKAFQELMGPLADARYLIERDGGRLNQLIYRPAWYLVRKGLRLEPQELRAYHKVPSVLASRREQAEALVVHWRRFVGGGRLIYTRNLEGRRILLQARAAQKSAVRPLAFEFWR